MNSTAAEVSAAGSPWRHLCLFERYSVAKLKIGIFGDGCLGLKERIRDGVTIDRRAWMRELTRLGHDVTYFSHRTKDPDFQCGNLFDKWKVSELEFEKTNIGAVFEEIEWPQLDILVIESRTRIFGPYGSIMLQYMFLKHYMNTSTEIMFWDFDIGNTLSIIGKPKRDGTIASIYAGAPYEENDPIFFQELMGARRYFTYLIPHDVGLLNEEEWPSNVNQYYFAQGVNEEFYNRFTDVLFLRKEYDLVYNGSDFNRREKFKAFYGDWSECCSVGLTGNWGSKKGSKEFLEQFPHLHMFGYLDTYETYEKLRLGKMMIQIGQKSYEKYGNFIQRLIEGCFTGTLTFADSDLKTVDKYFIEDYVIEPGDVGEALDFINSLSDKHYIQMVQDQRQHFLDAGYAWKDKVKVFLNIYDEVKYHPSKI